MSGPFGSNEGLEDYVEDGRRRCSSSGPGFAEAAATDAGLSRQSHAGRGSAPASP